MKRRGPPKKPRRIVIESREAAVPVDVAETGGITLQLERVACGNVRCRRCSRGPSHGPYWYAYIWKRRTPTAAPRLVSRYIGKTLELAKLRRRGEGRA